MVMQRRLSSWRVVTLMLTATLAACGGDSTNKSIVTRAGDGVVGRARAGARAQVAVRTATAPDDPCGWIPVDEVEAIVGKLAGPPRPGDGCRYTLAMPESVRTARQEALAEDANDHAISLTVSIGETLGSIGTVPGVADRTESLQTTGWDSATPLRHSFSGRIGHIAIVVMGEAPDLSEEPLRKLAERVRDRIPDLPFQVTNPYQIIGGGTKNPCLLTRAEAEAVLGPLVVDPYLASSAFPPLAHEQGYACAYFTPGHHALVIEPVWGDGRLVFGIEKRMGGIGIASPERTAIPGPWDEAHVSATGRELLFLKGNDLLKVHYVASSTDRNGAVTLATKAMQRLAS